MGGYGSTLRTSLGAIFIAMVDKHNIAHHQKKLGQLFCDHSSQKIINMLREECERVDVDLRLAQNINSIDKNEDGFEVILDSTKVIASSLVVATGGLSVPKIGATGFGYQIAQQFGLNVLQQRPGLVPLVFNQDLLERCRVLTGISVDAEVSYRKVNFAEGLLFTHRGLSGPSILQISSYWQETQPVVVNLAPQYDVAEHLSLAKRKKPITDVVNCLAGLLPKRLAAELCDLTGVFGRLAEVDNKNLCRLGRLVNEWELEPSGTEGYRTAEVTLGGVDTKELSSKTMEAKAVAGLYFIGEVVDVTGHLGGYNFQWAWSSGFVAGQHV